MTSGFGLCVFALGTVIGIAITPIQQVAAQSGSNNAAPICMARVADNGAALNIILPAASAGAMRAKGFEAVPCGDNFASAEQRESYRDAMCSIASQWREEAQKHFERERGERPAVLCGMAEVAVSRWKRGGGK